MQQATAAALPPPDFHIASVAELNAPALKAHAAWAAAHPDLDLWETTRTSLLEHGDLYFATLRNAALPSIFQATVVSQLSLNRILVNVDNVPGGDAILRFDASNVGAIRPGTAIRFRGFVDSYTADPYILTFVIQNPKADIVWRNVTNPKHTGTLARVFKGLVHFVQHLA
jgi:hypothetical protein